MDFCKFCRAAAWCLVVLLVAAVVLNVVAVFGGASAFNALPAISKLPLGLLGALGALSLFGLWPAMMWHCATSYPGGILGKLMWFLMLLFTIPVGTLAYYFVVFEPRQKAMEHPLRSS
jgi:hypothetical protein